MKLYKKEFETSVGKIIIEQISDCGITSKKAEHIVIPFRCSLAEAVGGKTTSSVTLCKYSLSLAMTKKQGNRSFGIYDSELEELGEAVFQLHENTEVDRPCLPLGVIVACDGFVDPSTDDSFRDYAYEHPVQDGEKLFQPEVMLGIARAAIEYAKQFADMATAKEHKIYFAYVGLAEKWDDDEMPKGLLEAELKAMAAFKAAGFAVFRNYYGATMGDKIYLAVHCDAADHPDESEESLANWQKSVKEFPRYTGGDFLKQQEF